MARGVGGKGPANIMKHIKGLHFPATKQEIIENAKKAPGPDTDEVINVLEKIPDGEYGTPPEILKAVGKVE